MTNAASAPAKTWGPFNGRQLSTIIVALVTVVFFPSAAWAVDTYALALPRPPSTPWNAAITVGLNHGNTKVAGPSSTPINLTSMSFGTVDADVTLLMAAYSVPLEATKCTTALETHLGTVYYLAGKSGTVATSVSFPTPLVVAPPANRKVCLFATGSGPVYLNASGYFGA